MYYNKQYFAKLAQARKRITKQCPNCEETSGIYIFTRQDDEGFKFAYVGQAKKVLTRLAQHLLGYQHIDLSIRKHGLYNDKNKEGWCIQWFHCNLADLDRKEQEYIRKYHELGYQLRNKTSGSQGKGKRDIAEEPRKGYQEGLHNGYEKARKEIAHLFDLHLTYDVKKHGNKIQEKALKKFEEFIGRE